MKGFQPETDVRSTDGPTVAAMKRAGVPLNRENYLYWAFMGEPPEGEIDAELEETFPAQFRRAALDEPGLTDKIQ
jgi:hypothetical protein